MKKIEVEIEEVEKGSMYLTQHLGNGSLGDTEFDASLILPNYSMVVTVGEKKYVVSSQSLISSIVDYHLEETKKK